jgi:hypothetical protein
VDGTGPSLSSVAQKSICLAGLVSNCEVVGSTSAVYVTQGPDDESAVVTHLLSVSQK